MSARCKSCQAPIVWLITSKGKRCPVDLIGRDGQEVGDREMFSPAAHIAHWATCPNADQHRQGGERRPAKAGGPSLIGVTLLHPWPWAVMRLHCRVLTMPSYAPCPPGTHLALHAAAIGWCRVGERACLQRGPLPPQDPPRGAIVAVARYVGLAEEGQDPWQHGPIGWRIDQVLALPEPVPHPGCDDPVWVPIPELVQEVRRQYRAGLDAGRRESILRRTPEEWADQ